jgi:hypothetical protein
LLTEFFDQSFRLTGTTLKANLKKKSLEELTEAQKAARSVANDSIAQSSIASFFNTEVQNVQAHLQTIEGWIADAIAEKQPKQAPAQPVAPPPPPAPAIEKKPEPIVPTPYKKVERATIEAKIIEPKAVISEIKIPLDKVHNLLIFIEPSVKRGRLFEFQYSSLPQLKEMLQTANEIYQDDNTMRYIAEQLRSDLPSVKISLWSLIGQLPKQIAQMEAAQKKEKQEPRRWTP